MCCYLCLLQSRGPVDGTPHKLKVLTGPSEIAANVIDNPLEASVELGSEVALSRSQNDARGVKLMSHNVISGEGRGRLTNVPLKLGEKKAGSAFFKPIMGLGETDELKLGAAENVKLFKPTPTIRVNDADLRLSPGSPRLVSLGGVSTTGFAEPTPTDPSEEVRAIFERGQLAKKESLETPQPQSQPGRESPSSRRDSINQLQRLQQKNRVPCLGGKVSGETRNQTHYTCPQYISAYISSMYILASEAVLSLLLSLTFSFLYPLFPSFLPPSLPPSFSSPLPLSVSVFSQYISTLKPAKELLKDGRRFTFRVTILQATGIPRDFTDVFLQFRFLNGGDEAFSTISLKNENQDLALGFYHMQNVR